VNCLAKTTHRVVSASQARYDRFDILPYTVASSQRYYNTTPNALCQESRDIFCYFFIFNLYFIEISSSICYNIPVSIFLGEYYA
jgi:hypothetical protein